VASARAYGGEFFSDLLAFESSSERVVWAGENFTAYVPFAARWPIEIHLLPHRHVPDLEALEGEEKDELAVIYRTLLRAIDALYDTPTPYIAAWHQAPVRHNRDLIRLMLQITSPRRAEDKLKYLAGSEAAMGAFIGDVAPEEQAERIRVAWESVS
jgi:UDPglucose--hexose-1-phosphate uridylyltransferase